MASEILFVCRSHVDRQILSPRDVVAPVGIAMLRWSADGSVGWVLGRRNGIKYGRYVYLSPAGLSILIDWLAPCPETATAVLLSIAGVLAIALVPLIGIAGGAWGGLRRVRRTDTGLRLGREYLRIEGWPVQMPNQALLQTFAGTIQSALQLVFFLIAEC